MVIGAGIIGASIAYHLSALGQRVIVLDAALPGCGVTRHSFAWIGMSPAPTRATAHLHELAHQDWRRLGEEVTGLSINWSGALTWGDYFANDVAPPVTEIAELEPHLHEFPAAAQFSAREGWVDPTHAAEQLIAAAVARGAEVHFGSPVRQLLLSDGVVVGVETADRVFDATTVVVAAGTGSTALCAAAGVELPLEVSPAIMVRLQAPAGMVRHIVANDDFEARQDADGVVWMPLDYAGEQSSEDLARTAAQARELFVKSFHGAAEARVLSSEVGWRPMPDDGDPIVGPTDKVGLYAAVAHPGMALASTLGRLVAEEVISGNLSPLLKDFRPTRFNRDTPRREDTI